MKDLLSLCDRAVELALKKGADEAEAMAVSGKEVNVEIQKNDLQIAKSMDGNALGLRVFLNRSLGFAYVNSFSDGDVGESVERAIGIASGAPTDEHNALPEPTQVARLDGVFDEASDEFGVDMAVDLALTMLRSAREYDARVTVDSGELAGYVGEKAISSSKGVRASEKSSFFYSYIFGMAKDGGTVSSFDYQFDGAWSPRRMDPAAIAVKLAKNVVGSLGAVKGESFRGPVILAPKAVAEILVSCVTAAASASAVQKETSRFRGRLGEKVAAGLITITDDATLADGSGSTAFDREGLSPEVLPIIDGGVLRNLLYDSYTARKDGRASNGHAGGGASSVPGVSRTNVIMEAGDVPVDDMVADIEKGVLVTRFSGNVDAVSGDFSGSVKGGRMIRGGRLEEPLSGTMIAGNAFELLPKVTAVSVERERTFSTVVPSVALDEVAVTSG
jgi:PmbA protein